MIETALAFDQNDVVMLIFEYESFGRAVDEVGHHTVDRAALAFDHDPGLARGDELRIVSRLGQRSLNFNRRDHLAHATIDADRVDA